MMLYVEDVDDVDLPTSSQCRPNKRNCGQSGGIKLAVVDAVTEIQRRHGVYFNTAVFP